MSALTAAFGLTYVMPALGQRKARQKVKAPTSSPEVRIPFGAQQSPLFYFTQETFRPYVGGIFEVSAGGRSVYMKLVEVRDCTPNAVKASPVGAVMTNSFVLKFSSPDELTDLTTIYMVGHGALGEFPLFLTRGDGPNGTSVYEAVFNHLF